MKDDREKLRVRLRALLAKTVKAGCTESEALAAAQKAAELMRKYAMDEDEIAVVKASMQRETKHMTLRDRLWGTVAYVTNTAVLYTYNSRTGCADVIFYGVDPWPEVARYLRDVLNRAITQEVATFRKSSFYKARRTTKTRRQAVTDFTQGIVKRLQFRVYHLFQDTISEQQADLAQRVLEQEHPATRKLNTPKNNKERFPEAAWAGRRAGDTVNLHHGVGGKGETLKIGGAA